MKVGKQKSIYGDRDPTMIPFCTFAECATWLRVPVSTLRSWFCGQKGFQPVLELSDPAERALSFVNVTETFVLAAIRRDHKLDMRKARAAVQYLRKHYGDPFPLARQEMLTDGTHLLVRKLSDLVSASEQGQLVAEELVQAHLHRIERDGLGHATRLFPFSRGDRIDDPKLIMIDPRIQFGRPCLRSKCVPTAAIHDRFLAGDSFELLASDYDVSVAEVEEAFRFERGRAA